MVIHTCDFCGKSTKSGGGDYAIREKLGYMNLIPIRDDEKVQDCVMACNECFRNYESFLEETNQKRESTIRKWILDHLIDVKEEPQ